MRGKSHRTCYPQEKAPAFLSPVQPIPLSALPAQTLYERVLSLWHGGRHDTLSIALSLSVEEAEVCRIIEECEGRGNCHG